MSIAKGTPVRQTPKTIEGIVEGDFRVDQQTGKVQIPVTWIDDDGAEHNRYFFEDDLEVVTASK